MIPLLLLLCFQEPEVVIPSVGRPDRDFYNAAGEKVVVTQKVDSAKWSLAVPMTYTLDIRGLLNPKDVERPRLADIPFFKSNFRIENLPDPKDQAKDQRTFIYRLIPDNQSMHELPPFAFRYYDPRDEDPEAAFRLTTAAGMPIEYESQFIMGVKRNYKMRPVNREIEDYRLFKIDPDKAIAHAWFSIAFLAPLASFLAAYGLWRFIHPSDATRLRVHEGRIYTSSLKELRRQENTPQGERGETVWRISTHYLRARLGMPDSLRTTREYGEWLTGLRPEVRDVIVGYLDRCERARFQGDGLTPGLDDFERMANEVEAFVEGNV